MLPFNEAECRLCRIPRRLRLRRAQSIFLYYGRNAWHRTWVSQYQSGYFHTELRSAKDAAESQRTKGSTFGIEAMPALAIRSDAGAIILCEIDCPTPLKGYRIIAESSYREIKYGKRELVRSLRRGAIVGEIAETFRSTSRHWKVRYPAPNVLVFGTQLADLDFDPIKVSSLDTYDARSYGGSYLLSWGNLNQNKKKSAGAIWFLKRAFEL